MRVYDTLRLAGFRPVPFYMNFCEVKPEGLAKAEVILADNVADYLMEQKITESVPDDDPEAREVAFQFVDLPVLAPPFPSMFIEYHFRSSLLSTLVPDLRLHGLVKLGAFVNACELDHDVRKRYARRYQRDVRWIVDAVLYLEPIPFRIVGPILTVRFDVNSDGSHNAINMGFPRDLKDGDDDPKFIQLEAKMAITPMLLTICFLNCKNVEIETVRPDRAMPKQFKRRKAMPYTEYKIIDIRPLRTILRNEGRAHEVGLSKALHICRGHFKTYTPDNPLFGRVEGTFWWGNYARGTGPARVIKDYRVHAPAKNRNRLMDGEIGSGNGI